jgi:putative ATP-binding cassette transporter
VDERAGEYLDRLQLKHKVEVRRGELSTTDLSQGQRKRLALLTAFIEDRPIYLFDEWAADQDPEFKKVFYHQLLPELKGRGKTVFVITHDDHYFHVADHILKLEDGRVDRFSPQPFEADRHPTELAPTSHFGDRAAPSISEGEPS